MTKTEKPGFDADDHFARLLEREHANQISSQELAAPRAADELDARVEAARPVLELLEDVKHWRRKSEQSFVETGVKQSTGIKDSEEAAERPKLLPDLESIGRFKIHEQIGRGGFGIVLKAYDPRLQRDVAIKIPRLESAFSAEARQRFLREAKAAAALDHPNIVTVYETGTNQGSDYIVTQLREGEDLATLLARGRKFSYRQAAELVSQIADAIEHAHQRGVLHRDLKPSNIMMENRSKAEALTPDDQAAEIPTCMALHPRITDFGLASIADQQLDFTQTGAVLGTPAYMSPEQAKGHNREFMPQTDVYGIGTILYQLLVGQPPYAGLSVVDTMRAIVEQDPAEPRTIEPAIPKDLEAVCLKCLHKDPAGRYESAQMLQADLQRFLSNTPVLARRITRSDRLVRWARRNPALATVSCLAFVALTVALVLVTWQWRRAEQNVELANAQRIRAERNVTRVGETIDKMLNEVAATLQFVPQMSSLRKQILEEALVLQQQMVEEESQDDRVQIDTFRAYRRIAEIQYFLGKRAESLDSCQAALQKFSQRLETAPDDQWLKVRSEIQFINSLNLLDLGEPKQAIESLELAIKSSEAVSADWDPSERNSELSDIYRHLGIALELQNKNEAALHTIAAAIELARVANNDRMLARALNSMAIVKKKVGDLKAAKSFYQESIVAANRAIAERPDRIDLKSLAGTASFNLGNLFHLERDFAAAIVAYEEAHSIFQDLAISFPLSSRFRVMNAESLGGVGVAHKSIGGYDKAEAAYRKAIAEFESAIEDGVVTKSRIASLAANKGNLGNLLMEAGRVDEAREMYVVGKHDLEDLVAQFPEVLSYHRQLSAAIGNLSSFEMQQDKLDEANDLANQALKIALEVLASSPSDPQFQKNAGYQLRNLARINFRMDHHEQAIDLAKRMASLTTDSARFHLDAAGELVSCLAKLQRDPTPESDSGRDNTSGIADRYADAAIEILEQGLRLDESVAQVFDSKKFDALRRYERFLKLVDGLKDE